MRGEILSKKELLKLSELSKKLAEAERLLERLKKYHDTAVTKMMITPGMVNDTSSEILALEEGIDVLRTEQEDERIRLDEFLSRVPDIRTQTYLRLHYIKGLSWEDVATMTGTASAGVVRERVQQSLRSVRCENNENAPTLSHRYLSDFATLSKELSKKEMILETIRSQRNAITGSADISDDDVFNLQHEANELRAIRLKQLSEVESYLASVLDPIVQTFMRLHFVKGLNWDEVAKLTHSASGNAARTRVRTYMRARDVTAREICQTNTTTI